MYQRTRHDASLPTSLCECNGWKIPVHMVFPRLFTCPTAVGKTFKVEFEVNLVILFSDGHLLTENFPLKLSRIQDRGTGPL